MYCVSTPLSTSTCMDQNSFMLTFRPFCYQSSYILGTQYLWFLQRSIKLNCFRFDWEVAWYGNNIALTLTIYSK